MSIKLDHSVLHLPDWQVSKTFHREVPGAEVTLHGPGLTPAPLSRVIVPPGNSDLYFVWDGPIEGVGQHLGACGVPVELGPMDRFGAQGEGASVYVRDPDGSLLESISAAGRA